jgi:acetate kinase
VLWLEKHLAEGEDLNRVLDERCGLLALCGTADMREVHAGIDGGDHDAELAFNVWRHRLIALAGACIATLGGLDGLVFTGGIGENDPIARAALVNGLAWLGDVPVFVVAAREELQLAAEAENCLSALG